MTVAQTQTPAAKTPAAETAAAATADVAGDVVHGRQVLKKCQACHSTQPGKNMLGPSLAGIVGTKAGEVPHYSFSPAMKKSGLTWTPEKLDAYLADPQKVVPGNKMPFPGLKTAEDRTDVIAFLASDEAACITGQVYVIDGGTTVKRPRAAMVEWERFVAADAE